MARDGIAWDAVELDDGESIPPFDDYDALLVMGGPMDVWQTDRFPWLKTEIEAIREWVIDHEKPYFGFCLGHQLLAKALGGAVGAAQKPEIGIMPVALTAAGAASPLLRDVPAKFQCLQWHSAEVTRLPAGAEVLCSSPACRVNAMAWGGQAISVQFHVEITPTTVADWGKVPEYAAALELALGKGALQRLDAEAADKMPVFNSISQVLYNNFSANQSQNFYHAS